ncbi:MAG: type II toxin-antitoxin system VapC family toxin [Defluviitaleaceae bacterium]|nr:type II toxin-antitoxin system VapC family toxin [Defluviitaleaceae bacterium]
MTNFVLDACAVVALLKNEDGGAVVESLLIHASDEKADVFMHRANLIEVYYGFLREDGKKIAKSYVKAIENSRINIIDNISQKLMFKAGELKTDYKLSFADTFAVALAMEMDASLVTSDHHEMDVLDNNNVVSILWIR